jgi:acyl-CoA reductase-like NAD-dependent aldehyde dehydrogenase
LTLQTINPATGAVVASHEETSPAAVQAIIASAHRAYLGWRSNSFGERAALMSRAAEVLPARSGKPSNTMAFAWRCVSAGCHALRQVVNSRLRVQ